MAYRDEISNVTDDTLCKFHHTDGYEPSTEVVQSDMMLTMQCDTMLTDSVFFQQHASSLQIKGDIKIWASRA